MPRVCCSKCSRPEQVCYCHLLTRVNNHWPVQILQHQREAAHPLNTARIAALSLARCTVLKAADSNDDRLISAAFTAGAISPVLIYPASGSQSLEALQLRPGNSLLFIDATWRKSRRLFLQSPWLQQLPAYHLNPQQLSRYQIRKEPEPGHVSTLEAIVSVLEHARGAGPGDQPASMLGVMDWMIAQQVAAGANSSGINNVSKGIKAPD